MIWINVFFIWGKQNAAVLVRSRRRFDAHLGYGPRKGVERSCIRMPVRQRKRGALRWLV